MPKRGAKPSSRVGEAGVIDAVDGVRRLPALGCHAVDQAGAAALDHRWRVAQQFLAILALGRAWRR